MAWVTPEALALHGIDEPIPLVEVSTFVAEKIVEDNPQIPLVAIVAAALTRGFVAGYLHANGKEGGD